MTAKEKAIAEAYNGLESKLIDKNGWAPFYEDEIGSGGIEPFGDYETRNHKDGRYEWRPKSLSGIENNNGWTRIESESDLPKEKDSSYYWYDIRVKSRMEALKMILEPVSLEYLKQLHRADICTHWKKAEVQPSPIY